MVQSEKGESIRIRASGGGKVVKWDKKKGDKVEQGTVLLEISDRCTHPTLMKDMCAECGADLREVLAEAREKKEDRSASSSSSRMEANIAMVHSIPELKVSSDVRSNA